MELMMAVTVQPVGVAPLLLLGVGRDVSIGITSPECPDVLVTVPPPP
jgi:hypothetical protein